MNLRPDTEAPARDRLLTASGVVTLLLALALSLRSRGPGATTRLALIGLGLPAAAELGAVNVTHTVRHHGRPRVLGVPISAVVGWFNITYGCLAIVERLAARWHITGGLYRWFVPLGVAGVATSLDLVLDCYGLDEGLWEWPVGGAYATEIVGRNGQRGIPWLNYGAWLALTSGVTALARPSQSPSSTEPGAWSVGGLGSARAAAGLVLPYYLSAAAWAIRNGKPRYLLLSGLFPLSVFLATRE